MVEFEEQILKTDTNLMTETKNLVIQIFWNMMPC
jgi:hypothetical protein